MPGAARSTSLKIETTMAHPLPDTATPLGKRLRRAAGYLLSLPERSLRSVAALTAGTTGLLSEALLPEAIRNSSSYRVTVGLFHEFLTQQLAGMEQPGGRVKPRFVERKLLGNVLEAAGLLTMRLSPLWVLALAGDALGGSKAFLTKLAGRLEANGVIPNAADISAWEDLLGSLQHAAGTGAMAVDQPPLSRQELAELSEELRANISQALRSSADLLVQLTEIWSDMETVAEREGVPLEQVGGVMTFDAAALLRKGANTVRAAGESGVALIDEAVLDSYRHTLKELNESGLRRYLRTRMRPFLRAAGGHFDPERSTWTERLFGSDREKP